MKYVYICLLFPRDMRPKIIVLYFLIFSYLLIVIIKYDYLVREHFFSISVFAILSLQPILCLDTQKCKDENQK